MRFESKLPDDSVNIGEGSPAREAGLLIVGVIVTALVVTTLLAFSIEALVPMVPPSLEVRVFNQIAELAGRSDEADSSAGDDQSDCATDLPDSSDLSDAELRTERVQAILDRLATHWVDSPYPAFYVFVLDDPLPNAFALPGGAVGVTSGLLDRIETENELAFILGHELGHFAGRDHLRGLGRGLAISVVWMALGLSGDQVEGLASSASAFSARHFDRGQESDADLFGVQLLAAEYGHAAGTRAVFERVLIDPASDEVNEEEKEEDGDGDVAGVPGDETPGSLERLAGYLSTHPLGPDRIRALDTFIQTSGWATDGEQLPWIERAGDAAPAEENSDASSTMTELSQSDVDRRLGLAEVGGP